MRSPDPTHVTMNLTPLDIRKQDFNSKLWGYDPEDVEAFLDMVATQWEEMADARRRLENRVQELEQQMAHYQKVEEALQEALDQTRRNAEEKLENARQEAKTIVQEAKADAKEIQQAARARRDRLENEAERLEDRRNEVAARLRAFLQSELEILDGYRDEPPSPEASAPSRHAPGDASAGMRPPDASSEAMPAEGTGPGGGEPEGDEPAPAVPSAGSDPDEPAADAEPDKGAPTDDFQDSLSDALEGRRAAEATPEAQSDWRERSPDTLQEDTEEGVPDPDAEEADGSTGGGFSRSERPGDAEPTGTHDEQRTDAPDPEGASAAGGMVASTAPAEDGGGDESAPETRPASREVSGEDDAEAETDADEATADGPEPAPDPPDEISDEERVGTSEADDATNTEAEPTASGEASSKTRASSDADAEKTKKDKRKDEGDQTSTEEIEKIWRILEDME
ncbi:MAG: DivIVA domain-containing protein [Salinibacter sp.]